MIIDPNPITLRAEDRASEQPPDLQATAIKALESLDGLVKDANYMVELIERFAGNPLDMLDRLQKTAVGLAKQAGAAQQSVELLSRARRSAGHYAMPYSEVQHGR